MRKIGSLLLCIDKKRRSIAETAIEFLTGDCFHIAGVIDDTEGKELVIEALVKEGVKVNPLQKYRDNGDVVLMCNPTFLTITQRQMIVSRWLSDEGLKYDKGNIFGKILRYADFTNSRNKRICSELIHRGHEDIYSIFGKDTARVTPNDYLRFVLYQNKYIFDREVL